MGLIGGVTAQQEVQAVWNKANAAVHSADETFAEIRERTQAIVEKESQEVESARRHVHETADALEKSAEEFKEAEKHLLEPVDPRSSGNEAVSSFLESMELPASLMQFPEVAADMEKVRAAEKDFQEKMKKLHQKDDDLMELARKDFSEGRKAISKIGHLRSSSTARKPSSFIETGKKNLSPLDKVLVAEERLKEVNDKLGREFGFIPSL
jgi:hypothetical protein